MAEPDLAWHNKEVEWLVDLVEADRRRHKIHKAAWTRQALAHSKKQLRNAKRARKGFIRASRKASQ